MSKAAVFLGKSTGGGVHLAGTSALAWRITAGTAPYTTIATVHNRSWPYLEDHIGQPLQLWIRDERGTETAIQDVYVLHKVASDSFHRTSFVIADRRWKWPYRLVVRDFNVPRKTGSITAFGTVPETRQYVDQFDYLPYSLKEDGKRWQASEALANVLDVVDPGAYTIENLPIKEGSGGETGQFTLQNVQLRDGGDMALGRMLSYIPGADIYVAPSGQVVVYDATDLAAAEAHLAGLPKLARTGEAHVMVDRAAIRPNKVEVFYQREIETLLEFSDDWNTTSSEPDRNSPFFENVVATVDLSTSISETDPETGAATTKTCPPGTWVRIDRWLETMDGLKPNGSAPWTFETIRKQWVTGLDDVLGAGGADMDLTASVAARVGALRAHFRQTFRINPRYMRRVRELLAVRVAVLDPVTGARAPASVWAQACIIANDKGARLGQLVYRNVDNTSASRESGDPIINTYPSPARVQVVDPLLGIFRIVWIDPPAGTARSFIPSIAVGDNEQPKVVSRDLAEQDDRPFGWGAKTQGAANGIYLAKRNYARIMLTLIPAAPNDERQFHRVEVEADQIAEMFRSEFGIRDGDGPTLQVFVPPGEMTARFAWGTDDETAKATLRRVFGLDGGNEPITELPGFVLSNEGAEAAGGQGGSRHISAHSRALAAELIAAFANSVQGSVVTIPTGDLRLSGNMAGATIRVAQFPSAVVDVVHQFPGQQRPISRFSLLPDSTRQQVLGTLPFR